MLATQACALAGPDPPGAGASGIPGCPGAQPQGGARLMLHASRLAFDHPLSGLRTLFESPAPF
jgi:23S rRNA-/tRNA-specific pseudouridylate synthase